MSALSEDSSRNWRDTSVRVFSSTSGATMKVTTTFSCSRTRRGPRIQRGLMCPSVRYYVKENSDENNISYPKLEKWKIKNERYLSKTCIYFKSGSCSDSVCFQVRVLSILNLAMPINSEKACSMP